MSHFTSIIGSITLDESSGLQNDYEIGDAFPGDEDDNDILYSQSLLPSALWSWLDGIGLTPLDVALSNYDGSDDTMASTKMVDIDGSDLDPLRFASDSEGTELPVYDPGDPPADPSVGVASGIYDLDGNQIYLFQLDGDPNIVVGIDATGDYSLAIYLDQTTTNDGTNLQARIWTVQFEPLKHPIPGDDDEAISLDDVLYLTATDNISFDATDAPSGQSLFIMFGESPGNYDYGVVATGKQPINQSDDPSAITAGDTVNTSKAGGPTTFGVNNQMLTASSTPGEGDGIVFTFVTGTEPNYTVPDLDQNEADVEQNIEFSGVFSADKASFDIVQLQGGKTAVVKTTAYNSTNVTAGTEYIDGQLADLENVVIDSDPDDNYGALSGTDALADGAYTVATSSGTTIFNASGDDYQALIDAINADGYAQADIIAGDLVITSTEAVTLTGFSGIGDLADGVPYEPYNNRVDIIELEYYRTPSGKGAEPAYLITYYNDETHDYGDPDINAALVNGDVVITDNVNDLVITFTEEGELIVDGAEAGDTLRYTTDGDHNRVLIENAGDDSGQDSANFDIGGFALLDIASETVEVGDKILWEDDGPALGSTSPELVEEEQINNAYSVGNEDYGVPLLDTDTEGDLNVVTQQSVLDYNAVVSAGTDEQAQFSLDVSGLPEDGVAYDSISGLLKTGLTAGSTIADGAYSIDDGTTTYTYNASSNTLQDLVDDINANAGTVATAEIIGGRLVLTSTDADQLTLTGFEDVIYEAAPTLSSKGAQVNFDFDSVVSVSGTATLLPTDTIPDVVYSIADSTTTYNFDPAGTTVQDLIDEINLGTVATAALVDGNLVLESVNGDPLTLTNFELFDSSLEDDTPYDTVTYTLTGTVVSITGATALELTDPIADATYTITNTVPADDFSFVASGNTLQDLIDEINDSSVATAALVGGELVIESLNGDDLTLGNFDNIAPSLVDGTYDDTRDVLTWSVTDDGTSTFTVLDQIDHATGSGENTLLINLQGYLYVVDGDDDPIADLDDLGKYNVIDDVPIESDSTEVATVEEEHSLAGANEDTTGGVAPYVDADTLVGPDYDQTKNTASGNLQSLVLVGTDEVVAGGATFDFADMTQGELDAAIVALGLSSQGEAVTTATIVGNTLTASTSVADGSDDIFSLTLEENGDYTFTLIRTLDHDATADGGDDTENLETIDLTGFIMATDFDGDEIVLGTSGEDSSSFLVKVIDDIPVETGSIVTGTVEEEHGLTGGNEDATGGTVGTVVIDGDLDNDNTALDGGFTLAAGVYTLATSSGTTTFTAPGDGTDLQDLIDAINSDGWADAEIIGGDLIITSDEAVTLTGYAGSGLGDFVDGTPYVEGVDEDTEGPDDYTKTTNATSGNLQSLVSIGTDQVASDGGASFDFAFEDDAALDAYIVTLGLSSQGEDVTQADISGNTLTAKTADGDAIFTLLLESDGDYTFTLLRNLDNPDPGAGATEDVLTIDLSGLIMAEDFDGDEIVLGSSGGDSSSFLIYAIDDTPILEVGNLLGTGTSDPQIGEWADLPGADGFQSLDVELVSFTYGPSATLVTLETDLGTPTVGPDGELIFENVAITADFDNNPLTGDGSGEETLTFDLTFNPDGTYVFNLDELFVSSISFSSDDGQLPAGGPDSVQTLPVGDDDILFFALDPLAYADSAEWVGDGSPPPEPDYIVTDVLQPILNEAQLESLNPSFLDPAYLMNVSTSGIGVNNNNLQGDGIADITSGDQSFIVNTETPLTSMDIYIDNSVGGYNPDTEELYYRVFFVDGTYTDFMLVEDGDLTAATGGQEYFTIDWEVDGDGTSMIDAVQVTMGLGKIKIPTIFFYQETAVALDPITINLEATLTDNDDDAVTDQFSVVVETDDDPLSGPDITFNGTADADAFNIDLASGFTEWVINGFDSTDGVEIDGDTIILLNPLYDYDFGTNVVTDNAGDDVITINGSTITVTNGTDELTAGDIQVAYSDTVIDGNILVGDTLNQDLTGTADADALIVKEDLDELTGAGGGDAFVFIDPANQVNLITDFDSSEGDFLVISASGFGVDVDEGQLSSDNFVSGAGAAAADADDYFLFDTATDQLWFDADGDGLGEAPVLIATFNFDSGTLTADDIFMIT